MISCDGNESDLKGHSDTMNTEVDVQKDIKESFEAGLSSG